MNATTAPRLAAPGEDVVRHRAASALAAAERAQAWALPLLAELVGENTHAQNLQGLAACRRRLAPVLRDLGFTVSEPTAGAGALARVHLEARTPLVPGNKTVLLMGHLDTVFAPDHPFRTLTQRGSRWCGPGVADMKGGIVTALVAVAAFRELAGADQLNLRLFLCADEEQGSPTGAELLLRAADGADVALCFEAARPGGGLVTARKGYGSARIRVGGRTGHAGIAHDQTVNALTVLARFLVGAEALEDGAAGLTVSPGGQVSASPTMLSCVPDRAHAELEWRAFDQSASAAMPGRLAELARTLAAQTSAQIDVDAQVETPAMSETEASRTLFAHYRGAAAALGLSVEPVATAGVGDINLVAAVGVACLDGVGPEGGGFHTDAEHLDVASVAPRAAMSALVLAGLCA